MKKLITILLVFFTMTISAQTTIRGAIVSNTNGQPFISVNTDSSMSLSTAYLAVIMSGPLNGYITVTFSIFRNLYAYTAGITPYAVSGRNSNYYVYYMPAPDGIPDFALTYSKPLMLAYLNQQGFTVIGTF